MQRLGTAILIADIGGTKSAFALARQFDDETQLENMRSFASKDFERFNDLLVQYLASCENTPGLAVLAVAGPILDGRANVTNLSWHLNRRELESEFGFTAVRLINDLEGMAWSIPSLAPDNVVVLQEGVSVPEGPKALIAPGTGLGEAFLTLCGNAYVAHASEGGHADFAPRDATQDSLLAHLRNEFDHVSIERVCSGTGLANIYRFLARESGITETSLIQERLHTADDITPAVVTAAMSGGSSICERAIELFVDVLAAETGNLALRTMATGGVYIGGGIPIRILPFLQSPRFIDRFTSKGRFSGLLERIPVSILRDPQSVLRGAAHFGTQLIKDGQHEGRRR